MVSHSPAPWKLTQLSTGDFAVADERGRVIAIVMHMVPGDGEALANARLMVGSPIILACLQQIVADPADMNAVDQLELRSLGSLETERNSARVSSRSRRQ
jgi:hypothetical protein